MEAAGVIAAGVILLLAIFGQTFDNDQSFFGLLAFFVLVVVASGVVAWIIQESV